jgi:hypothetical protein
MAGLDPAIHEVNEMKGPRHAALFVGCLLAVSHAWDASGWLTKIKIVGLFYATMNIQPQVL